jgi:hypothetical protein
VDEASIALGDALLAGRLAPEAFVEQYLAQRTAYHALDMRLNILASGR